MGQVRYTLIPLKSEESQKMIYTSAMIELKQLRNLSGAGMMDAKKALIETGGNMDEAVVWLRTRGLAKAARKSSRIAAEGLIAIHVNKGNGVAVEVNSETDFVAKNSAFQKMVGKIACAAQDVDNVDALLVADLDGRNVADTLIDKIATIGENISVRRMARLSGDRLISYIHNAETNNMGKIGVLVAMSGGNETIGKQIAMHIAAVNPIALSEADMKPEIIRKEKQVQMDIARESGKPEQVIEKMIMGRMKKFIAESTLLNQKFVVNPDLTVKAAAKQASATITGFIRMEVGEGIVVEKEDFATEVAKAAQG